MPYIMIKKIQNNYRVNLRGLYNLYPAYFDEWYLSLHVNFILTKIFNERGEYLRDITKNFSLPINREAGYKNYWINIKDMCIKYAIPVEYYVTLVVTSFKKGSTEYPILPYETKIESDNNELEKIIIEELERIERLGRIYTVPSLLLEIELREPASDLNEGLKRYENKDFEGAIKFFRKVLEGFKVYIGNISRIDGLEKRAEEFKVFVNKVYSLASNFGEHYRTAGGPDEARFLLELISSLTYYMASKKKIGALAFKE